MKTKRLNIAIALLAVALIGTSCGNKQQKSSSDTTTEQATSSALSPAPALRPPAISRAGSWTISCPLVFCWAWASI